MTQGMDDFSQAALDWSDEEWLYAISNFPPNANWRDVDAAIKKRRAEKEVVQS